MNINNSKNRKERIPNPVFRGISRYIYFLEFSFIEDILKRERIGIKTRAFVERKQAEKIKSGLTVKRRDGIKTYLMSADLLGLTEAITEDLGLSAEQGREFAGCVWKEDKPQGAPQAGTDNNIPQPPTGQPSTAGFQDLKTVIATSILRRRSPQEIAYRERDDYERFMTNVRKNWTYFAARNYIWEYAEELGELEETRAKIDAYEKKTPKRKRKIEGTIWHLLVWAAQGRHFSQIQAERLERLSKKSKQLELGLGQFGVATGYIGKKKVHYFAGDPDMPDVLYTSGVTFEKEDFSVFAGELAEYIRMTPEKFAKVISKLHAGADLSAEQAEDISRFSRAIKEIYALRENYLMETDYPYVCDGYAKRAVAILKEQGISAEEEVREWPELKQFMKSPDDYTEHHFVKCTVAAYGFIVDITADQFERQDKECQYRQLGIVILPFKVAQDDPARFWMYNGKLSDSFSGVPEEDRAYALENFAEVLRIYSEDAQDTLRDVLWPSSIQEDLLGRISEKVPVNTEDGILIALMNNNKGIFAVREERLNNGDILHRVFVINYIGCFGQCKIGSNKFSIEGDMLIPGTNSGKIGDYGIEVDMLYRKAGIGSVLLYCMIRRALDYSAVRDRIDLPQADPLFRQFGFIHEGFDKVGRHLDNCNLNREALEEAMKKRQEKRHFDLVYLGMPINISVSRRLKGNINGHEVNFMDMDAENEISIKERIIGLMRGIPGGLLSETVIAERAGVERKTVREAVKSLAGEGEVKVVKVGEKKMIRYLKTDKPAPFKGSIAEYMLILWENRNAIRGRAILQRHAGKIRIGDKTISHETSRCIRRALLLLGLLDKDNKVSPKLLDASEAQVRQLPNIDRLNRSPSRIMHLENNKKTAAELKAEIDKVLADPSQDGAARVLVGKILSLSNKHILYKSDTLGYVVNLNGIWSFLNDTEKEELNRQIYSFDYWFNNKREYAVDLLGLDVEGGIYEVYIVVDRAGKVKGYMISRILSNGEGYIDRMCTDQRDNVKGRGTMLMEAIMERMKRAGVKKMRLTPRRAEESRNFYINFFNRRGIEIIEKDLDFIVNIDSWKNLSRSLLLARTAPAVKARADNNEADLSMPRSALTPAAVREIVRNEYLRLLDNFSKLQAQEKAIAAEKMLAATKINLSLSEGFINHFINIKNAIVSIFKKHNLKSVKLLNLAVKNIFERAVVTKEPRQANLNLYNIRNNAKDAVLEIKIRALHEGMHLACLLGYLSNDYLHDWLIPNIMTYIIESDCDDKTMIDLFLSKKFSRKADSRGWKLTKEERGALLKGGVLMDSDEIERANGSMPYRIKDELTMPSLHEHDFSVEYSNITAALSLARRKYQQFSMLGVLMALGSATIKEEGCKYTSLEFGLDLEDINKIIENAKRISGQMPAADALEYMRLVKEGYLTIAEELRRKASLGKSTEEFEPEIFNNMWERFQEAGSPFLTSYSAPSYSIEEKRVLLKALAQPVEDIAEKAWSLMVLIAADPNELKQMDSVASEVKDPGIIEIRPRYRYTIPTSYESYKADAVKRARAMKIFYAFIHLFQSEGFVIPPYIDMKIMAPQASGGLDMQVNFTNTRKNAPHKIARIYITYWPTVDTEDYIVHNSFTVKLYIDKGVEKLEAPLKLREQLKSQGIEADYLLSMPSANFAQRSDEDFMKWILLAHRCIIYTL
ncbi:MAG: GNAT family N-acetyltransferase, partial [Candidatus Omnitrophica bacterium]|nr:GNAT family N-acetyltransferase [Candidatus Omnitrophota bacterium]